MKQSDSLRGRGYLLDDLAQLSGCEYLSQLREKYRADDSVKNAVSHLAPDRYTKTEWSEAAEYVTGQKLPDAATEQEVRDRFLSLFDSK